MRKNGLVNITESLHNIWIMPLHAVIQSLCWVVEPTKTVGNAYLKAKYKLLKSIWCSALFYMRWINILICE